MVSKPLPPPNKHRQVPAGRRRRPALWLAALALPLAAVPVVVAVPASADERRDDRPVIDNVTNVVAQDPKEEGTGPTVVINGHGFGANPPRVTEAPVFDDTQLGQSALGVQANTRNLHLVDDGTFATDDIGFYDDDSDINSCYLTIGRWTDTQIIVMLDDADVSGACSAIDDDDDITVEVWSTDANGGFGDTPSSGVFEVDDVVPLGERASVHRVQGASGPLTGGTFNSDGSENSAGTIKVLGDRLHEASVVWFGDGGTSGAIAVPRCGDGQDPTLSACFAEADGAITVRPPASSNSEDKGVYVNVANGGGTSQLDCVTVFTCAGGVFYYQSPSEVFGAFDEDFDLAYPDTPVGFNGSIELGQSTCPGSAPSGGNELSYSVSATLSSGQVNLRGTPMTSVNAGGILSSLSVPMVMTIDDAVNFDLTIEGSLSGCAAIPLFGGELAGIGGGLYVMIGGSLTGSYTFHVTLNKGAIVLNTGYTPGGVVGASIESENCVDEDDESAPCLETTHDFDASGTVYFSPLWLDVSFDAGPFSFSANAGVTLAGRVQIGRDATDYEICYGGTYQTKAELDAGFVNFEYADSGAFWGPFHLLGNKPAICPLGAIEDDRIATSTTLTASEPEPSTDGVSVTYTMSVTPAEAGGTVGFTSNRQPIEDCGKVKLVDGVAECTVLYDGTGQFRINAVYAADRQHVDGAANLTQTISRAEQIIDFTLPDEGTFGGSEPLTATGGGSGEEVTFSVPSAFFSVCRLAYDEDGAPVVSYRGVGTCNVVARQAGAGGFKAAQNVVEVVEVGKAPQSIEFTTPTDAVTGGNSVLDATATSTQPTYAVDDASAEVCVLDDGVVFYLTAGNCTLAIDAPEDDHHDAASTTSTIVVGEAPTGTTLAITADTLIATVTSPGSDELRGPGRASTPAPAPIEGTVTFDVGGGVVLTAPTVDGVATVDHTLAPGTAHTVVATFLGAGDPNYSGSTTSRERRDPVLTTEVTSNSPRLRGWYSAPVTITTTCAPTTAPLSGTCAALTVLVKDRAYPDLTRRIGATDGGIATATVSGIRLDQVGPKIVYTIVRNPRGKQKPVTVKVTDGLSGVFRKDTVVTTFRTVNGPVTRYRTIAFDRAGNRSVLKLRYAQPRR